MTSVDRAMHRWPAAPKAAPATELRKWFLLQSGSTAAWFLAPRLACTRLPFAEPRLKMYSPALLLPTKDTALMTGSSRMKLTVLCAPWTTLMTPSGKPAFWASSAKIMAAPGSRSDGFRISVLPVTVAMGMHQSGIMAGKSVRPSQPRARGK